VKLDYTVIYEIFLMWIVKDKAQDIAIQGLQFLQNTYKHPLIYVSVCVNREREKKQRKNKLTALGI